jgi:hypothetical protein
MMELAVTSLFLFRFFPCCRIARLNAVEMEDDTVDGFGCRLCVLDNGVSFFSPPIHRIQREREIEEVRGNTAIAGPDLISWIAGYRTPAAKPGCRRQWMGKMSFSGILGQASFKQMKKGMGDGFLLL